MSWQHPRIYLDFKAPGSVRTTWLEKAIRDLTSFHNQICFSKKIHQQCQGSELQLLHRREAVVQVWQKFFFPFFFDFSELVRFQQFHLIYAVALQVCLVQSIGSQSLPSVKAMSKWGQDQSSGPASASRPKRYRCSNPKCIFLANEDFDSKRRCIWVRSKKDVFLAN